VFKSRLIGVRQNWAVAGRYLTYVVLIFMFH
jgi:hypothetical protein